MNKKAFTLVELLAVIVILAIILAIAIPSINNIIEGSRINALKSDEQMLLRATKTYVGVNDSYLPTNMGDTREVPLNTLQTNNFISTIKSPGDNSSMCDGYVLITKTGANVYDYTPHLDCVNSAGNITEDGLIGYWKLDGNAYDYSTSNNHGLLYGATATTNRFGSTGQALSFDGVDDYIEISSNFAGQTTYSISFWAKAISGVVMHIGNSGDCTYNPRVTLSSIAESGCSGLNSYNITNNYNNQWVNIVITRANSNFKTYINGNQSFSVTLNPVSNTGGRFLVGALNGGGVPNSWFNGAIDDIRIYNRALSSSEVKNIYDMEKP